MVKSNKQLAPSNVSPDTVADTVHSTVFLVAENTVDIDMFSASASGCEFPRVQP